MIYKLLWLGLPSSLLFLRGQFFALVPFDVVGEVLAQACASRLPAAINRDEYVRAQVAAAARRALAVAGVLLVISSPAGFNFAKHDPALARQPLRAVKSALKTV